ncbi:MAG: HAMP domain-containing histidine kinase [Deltaproteobacteria bacterium]|nr:HAMP domain-containing histidine kinase [Deltaproteobacteria bacterium]
MTGIQKTTDSSRLAFRRRLWIKLLIAYLIPVAFIVSGIGYLAYRAARVAMENQLGESLISAARVAATLVGKPRAVRLAPGDEESRTYTTLKQKLRNLKEAAQAESIYLFDLDERALVDSDGVFSIGEPIVKLAADRLELKAVFAGANSSSVLFRGLYGRLYKTGFSPVRIDGEIVAAVGVDGSARFFGPLAELGRTLAVVGIVALALVVLATLYISRRITRPVGRLAQAAKVIGQGELDREIEVETLDEIGVLAHTLNEMRKSIRERDQQLQMMLSGIAHEVRNPLGGIALFVGLLKEDLADNATALGHITRINTELDYLARVVNDFLDFARKRPLELEELSPEAESEEIRSLLAADIEQAQVDFVTEISGEVGRVLVDREKIRRALLNLVRNAIQASGSGGRVKLSIWQTDQEVTFAVSDTGPGIDEDSRKRIFEPFFTTRQKGTGLGLALVKRIVDAHGGVLSLDSEPGKGATFSLRLPLKRT